MASSAERDQEPTATGPLKGEANATNESIAKSHDLQDSAKMNPEQPDSPESPKGAPKDEIKEGQQASPLISMPSSEEQRRYIELKRQDRVLKFRSTLSPARLLQIIRSSISESSDSAPSEQKQVADEGAAEENKAALALPQEERKGLQLANQAIEYLELQVKRGEDPQAALEEPQKLDENDGEEGPLAGIKRLRPAPLAFNAIRKQDIENSVELAFLQRPFSPKNYRIFSDRDVNGSQKCKNFIGQKYHALFAEPVHATNQSDADSDNKTVYCICRRPFDPEQNSPRFLMFECEGPCRKWVHPYCFGDTYEQIIEYKKKHVSYFCTFCKPDEADSEKMRHLKERFPGI